MISKKDKEVIRSFMNMEYNGEGETLYTDGMKLARNGIQLFHWNFDNFPDHQFKPKSARILIQMFDGTLEDKELLDTVKQIIPIELFDNIDLFTISQYPEIGHLSKMEEDYNPTKELKESISSEIYKYITSVDNRAFIKWKANNFVSIDTPNDGFEGFEVDNQGFFQFDAKGDKVRNATLVIVAMDNGKYTILLYDNSIIDKITDNYKLVRKIRNIKFNEIITTINDIL